MSLSTDSCRQDDLGSVGYDIGNIPDWCVIVDGHEQTIAESRFFKELLEFVCEASVFELGEGWKERQEGEGRRLLFMHSLSDYGPLQEPMDPKLIVMFVLGVAEGIRNFSQTLSYGENREKVFRIIKKFVGEQEKTNDQEEEDEEEDRSQKTGDIG